MRWSTSVQLWLVVLSAVLWASSASLVYAGNNAWTSNGPEGGVINALAVAPDTPTTLYAGTERGGVFKSLNGGSTWSAVNTGLTTPNPNVYATGLTTPNIYALAVDPVTPTTLYAVTSGGVFKSLNGGSTWSAVNRPSLNYGVEALAVDPVTPTTLYAGTSGGGVFKSLNGGSAWSAVNTGLDAFTVRVLAVDPVTPTILYAGISTYDSTGSTGIVYKGLNGGNTWSAVTTGLDALAIRALAVDPVTPTTLYAGTQGGTYHTGGVFKSLNGGSTWSAVNTGLPTSLSVNSPHAIMALAVDPVTPTTLYAGTQGGVFKSLNGGSTWSATGLPTFFVMALAVDPVTPTTLYAGTNGGGVFKSFNGGSTWSAVTTGLTASSIYALAADPVTPTTLYAGTDAGTSSEGVFKSLNGGSSWSAVNTGLPATFTVRVLAVDPVTPTTLYAGTENTGNYGAFVYKSLNGGSTWSAITTGLPPPTIYFLSVFALAVDPVTPTTLYAGITGGGGGVYKSLNGGSTWNAVTTGLTTPNIMSLAVDPVTPTTLYAGTYGGGVFKSLNGGSTWSATGLPTFSVMALAVDPVTPTTLYAGAYGGGVYKSLNGGSTWSAINNGLPTSVVQALAVDPGTPTTLYAGADGGVYKSLNGGSTWSAINNGLTTPNVLALAFDPVTPTTLYAGTFGGGVFAITFSDGQQFTLTVTKAGAGSGTVTSSPAGISCGSTCRATFDESASVTLTAAAANGFAVDQWLVNNVGVQVGGTSYTLSNSTADETVQVTFKVAAATLADLIVENLTVTPSSGPAGTPVTVGFIIRNQGSELAPTSTTNLRLAASSTTVTTNDLLLISMSTLAIAAGDSVRVNQLVPLPSGVSPGTHFLWVIADVYSTANQSDETNDKANTPFTVIASTTRAAPTLLAPLDRSTHQATTPTFGWAAVIGATSYRLMIATSQAALPRNGEAESCAGCVLNVTPPGPSYVPMAGVLSPGTTYWWQVKGQNAAQPGQWSSQFSFTTAASSIGPVALAILDPHGLGDGNGDIRIDPAALAALAALSSRRNGVVADGVTRLILRVESPVPVTFALPPRSISLQDPDFGCVTRLDNQRACNPDGSRPIEVISPAVPVGSKTFAFALYVAPDGLDMAHKDIEAQQFRITARPAGAEELASQAFVSLYWPPVVLVHGLWGSAETWNKFAGELGQIRAEVRRVNYPPAAAFNTTHQYYKDNQPVRLLAGEMSSTRKALRSRGIAVTQIDVVGHSMGGLVARAYAEYGDDNYRNLDNFKKGYIHKLITVDTPHYGSPLADFIRTEIPGRDECSVWIKIPGRNEFVAFSRSFGPAIDDLREGSHPLLNDVGTTVPTHAIGTISRNNTNTERNLNYAMRYCAPEDQPNDILNQVLCPLCLGEHGEHDTVVPITSQLPNLGMAASPPFDSRILQESIVHADVECESFPVVGDLCSEVAGSPEEVGATDARVIRAKIRTLLATPITSSLFTKPSTNTVVASVESIRPLALRASSALEPTVAIIGTLDILQPTPGMRVHPGDQVFIQAAAPAGSPSLASALFVVGNASRLVNTPPFEVTYRVPAQAIGRLDIIVGAFDTTGARREGHSYVVVDPVGQLTTIAVEPTRLEFTTIGETLLFTVRGTFSDGVIRDITSAGATYRTLSGTSQVVEVTSAGIVAATGAGNDAIIIESSGVSIALYVSLGTVDALPNQPPSVNAGVDATISRQASAPLHGTSTDDNLPNPPGAVTTRWTQVSGPGTVTFGNAAAVATTASVSQAGVYVLRLTASDGALSASDDVTITTVDVDPERGLYGEYFADPDLTTLVLTRLDSTVDFDWDLGAPDARLPADDFSVRWTGQLQVDVDATYTFNVTTDDGTRLWIDGYLVIDAWQSGRTAHAHMLALAAGVHTLKLEFFEERDQALVHLAWSSPSTPFGIIPPDHLRPSAATGAAPLLAWTGEPGCGADGLDPATGDTTTIFTYCVLYTDADGDAPLGGAPRVHILAHGAAITGSPFVMAFAGGPYTTGALYTYSTTLPRGRAYSYYFDATDTTGRQAVATPIAPTPTAPLAGPQMLLPNGDVNTDGQLTPADALMTFRYFLGLAGLNSSQQFDADTNEDGHITPGDALCIFHAFLRLPSCLD